MRVDRRSAVVALAAVSLLAGALGGTAEARTVKIGEFKLSKARMDKLRSSWVSQVYKRHSLGTWAPLRFDLSDRDLKVMGLPSEKVLMKHRYRSPTAFYPGGKMKRLGTRPPKAAEGPSVISFAGTGFFGIRPGAFLLVFSNQGISLCSMAHVYGAPGSYSISTAGHCGNRGDTAAVIGAVGNHTESGAPVPVIIDFGRFGAGTGDGGIGRDWALIPVDSTWQNLVTPTMAFWGGPIGMYTPTGEVVSADLTKGQISTNPNPTLVQQLVHYGHGLGLGPGGTPRSGTAITWRSNYYAFFGAISPGDSGSGSNTLTGDTIGANREAAGINTHIYVDGSLRTGVGTMAGTRATQVAGSLTNGQILPYPVPAPILP